MLVSEKMFCFHDGLNEVKYFPFFSRGHFNIPPSLGIQSPPHPSLPTLLCPIFTAVKKTTYVCRTLLRQTDFLSSIHDWRHRGCIYEIVSGFRLTPFRGPRVYKFAGCFYRLSLLIHRSRVLCDALPLVPQTIRVETMEA